MTTQEIRMETSLQATREFARNALDLGRNLAALYVELEQCLDPPTRLIEAPPHTQERT